MSRTRAPFRLTAGLIKPIAEWIRDLGGRRTVADLPDYLLSDIGLRRDPIAGIAADEAPAAETAPAAPKPRPAEIVPLRPARAPAKPRPEGPLAA